MQRIVLLGSILTSLAVAVPTHAGWIAEWSNTATRASGTKMPSETATMLIADGKMKVSQAKIGTMTDYKRMRFTLFNPERKFYWEGTIEEYLEALTAQRDKALGEQFTSLKKTEEEKAAKKKAVDAASLPRIVVKKTEETKEIVGQNAVKYVVEANGQLFQELWIASGVDISKDIDPDDFVAVQQKMSSQMLGHVAAPNKAIYLSPEYVQLLKSGFPLETVNHHGAGQFNRTATAFRAADVSADEFKVPSDFRRVKYADVFPEEKDNAASR